MAWLSKRVERKRRVITGGGHQRVCGRNFGERLLEERGSHLGGTRELSREMFQRSNYEEFSRAYIWEKLIWGKQGSGYSAGYSGVEAVYRSLETRELKFQLLQYHLNRAQHRMVTQANKHRSDVQFKEGDRVYLKIQPYRQVTLSGSPFSKLSAKYYGPYRILQKIGRVAYKLSLPAQLSLHPTFHVSQLQICNKLPEKINHSPVVDIASPYCPQPQKVLERRMIQKGNKVGAHVLIQ